MKFIIIILSIIQLTLQGCSGDPEKFTPNSSGGGCYKNKTYPNCIGYESDNGGDLITNTCDALDKFCHIIGTGDPKDKPIFICLTKDDAKLPILGSLKKMHPDLVQKIEFDCSDSNAKNGDSCKFMASGYGSYIGMGKKVTPGQCWKGACHQLCVRGACFTSSDLCVRFVFKDGAMRNPGFNISKNFVHYRQSQEIKSFNLCLNENLSLDSSMIESEGPIVEQKCIEDKDLCFNAAEPGIGVCYSGKCYRDVTHVYEKDHKCKCTKDNNCYKVFFGSQTDFKHLCAKSLTIEADKVEQEVERIIV